MARDFDSDLTPPGMGSDDKKQKEVVPTPKIEPELEDLETIVETPKQSVTLPSSDKKRNALKWIKRGFIGTLVGGSLYIASLIPSLPTPSQIDNIKQGAVTRVYSSDNQLIEEHFIENRELAPIDSMPQDLIKAVIATEDAQFREHNGVNYGGLANAILSGFSRGGSGITQQLAKNLFVGNEKSISRKIKEGITAVRLENRYDKDKILELYLNQAYLGSGVYGIKAASKKYFRKNLGELSQVECALLAGMIQSPERYRPDLHPKRANKRKNIVLWKMLKDKKISKEDYDSLKKENIPKVTLTENSGVGAYFIEEVRKTLSPKIISYKDFYSKGYNIYTTLNFEFQKIAEHYVKKILDRKQKNFKGTDKKVQAALVSIDNSDGAIVAMVGGRDFSESKFNRAVQAMRSPGSSFKPVVYAAALDNGYEVESMLMDIPFVYKDDLNNIWIPKNYKPDYIGPVSLKETCKHSRNIPTILLGKDIGLDNVITYAKMLGVKSKMRPYPSLAIGAFDATPLEMTSVYSVFANDGIYREPFMINKVILRDGKELIVEHEPKERTALNPDAAYKVVEILESVIQDGTGRGAKWYGFTRPAGGKTGTTNDCKDAWFIGFTPQYTTGVWVGLDDRTSIGNKETGAKAALPIWAQFMKDIHKPYPIEDFKYKLPKN